MLVESIIYTDDLKSFSAWLLENRGCDTIPSGEWAIKDNKAFCLIPFSASKELNGAPCEIMAECERPCSPWEKLTDEQIANLVEIKGWATDENGNAIITEIYKPFQFMV